MIETTVLDHLQPALSVPVYMEYPDRAPESFVVVRKVDDSPDEHINYAAFVLWCYGGSELGCAQLCQQAIDAVDSLNALPQIVRCEHDSDYTDPDERHKRNRYKAEFDITYYRD